ncbi:MAG: O-acetyl-ADP-ribose deacetylase [Chrysiogenetes bacterium]|nr:O-acetyl-ADP-ribose deacetylase [Chrysiogenetes bacterium]
MQRKVGNAVIELIEGDITKVRADALVTAANSGLRGGGGVDGAIHRAAGPRLLEACRAIGGCPTGSAVITPAFDLESGGVRHVVHAVGPIWNGGAKGEEALLRGAYRTSLEVAAKAGCTSIAFPSISTGVYGYPIALAAPVAISEVASFLRGSSSIERVVFALFGSEAFGHFERALHEFL